MPQPSVPPNFLAFAHELADRAGEAILPHFRRRIAVENKDVDGGYDPVTEADRAAERVVRELVAERFPEHGFEGEEYGDARLDARFRWVVDPIDGTRSFVLGMPVWGTLIGLTDGGRPLIGIMDQPFTRERFFADHTGAWLRGPDASIAPITTRPCAELTDAMMMTTHPDLFAAGDEQAGFQAVKHRVRACRYGGDCYSYCMLAAGHLDVVVEAGLKPFDVTALVPIVERAGGVVTTWDGGPADRGGRIVAAGDRRLHEAVLKVLAAVRPA